MEDLMARSLVAACLAFAGVFVLAGAGWALLAGACLVFAPWRCGQPPRGRAGEGTAAAGYGGGRDDWRDCAAADRAGPGVGAGGCGGGVRGPADRAELAGRAGRVTALKAKCRAGG